MNVGVSARVRVGSLRHIGEVDDPPPPPLPLPPALLCFASSLFLHREHRRCVFRRVNLRYVTLRPRTLPVFSGLVCAYVRGGKIRE